MREQLQIANASALATVRQLLQRGAEFLSGAGVESARLDAELLLSRLLGWSREELWLKDQALVEAAQMRRFEFALRRRARREPIAHITGVKEFWSLDFVVGPEVLVPRPETELLVEVAIGLLNDRKRDSLPPLSLPLGKGEIKRGCAERTPKILDLGTGSGAIAVSLAREPGDVAIWASDVSQEALEVAQANARRHGVQDRIRFVEGDLFEPVRDRSGFFQMIVSNPPYIRRGEFAALPREIRDFEPRIALDGGLDGLDFYRRIIEQGQCPLAPGGFMALEIGADMADEVCQLFSVVGCYSRASVYRDYSGQDRAVVARKL